MVSYSIRLVTRSGVTVGAFGNWSGLSYQSALNMLGGACNVSVPCDDPILGPEVLDPYAYEVDVLRREDAADGITTAWQVGFSGPIGEPTVDATSAAGTAGSTPLVAVKALPAFTWLDRRICKKDLTYTNWWVGDIIADLFKRAQDPLEYGANAGLRLQLRLPARSSKRITVTVSGRDQKGYGTIIRGLATYVDLREEYDLIDGVVVRTLAVYEPVVSRRSVIPLVWGSTMTGFRAARPMVATRITGIGTEPASTTSSPAAAPPVASAKNTALEPFYGVLEVPFSDTTISDQKALQSEVTQEVGIYGPRWVLGVSYTPSPATPWGFLQLGDTVRVKIDLPWPNLDEDRRVTGLDVSVDPSSGETVTPVTTEPPDLSGDVTSLSPAVTV